MARLVSWEHAPFLCSSQDKTGSCCVQLICSEGFTVMFYWCYDTNSYCKISFLAPFMQLNHRSCLRTPENQHLHQNARQPAQIWPLQGEISMMLDLVELLEARQHVGIASVPPQKSTLQQLTRQRDLRLQNKAAQLKANHQTGVQQFTTSFKLPSQTPGRFAVKIFCLLKLPSLWLHNSHNPIVLTSHMRHGQVRISLSGKGKAFARKVEAHLFALASHIVRKLLTELNAKIASHLCILRLSCTHSGAASWMDKSAMDECPAGCNKESEEGSRRLESPFATRGSILQQHQQRRCRMACQAIPRLQDCRRWGTLRCGVGVTGGILWSLWTIHCRPGQESRWLCTGWQIPIPQLYDERQIPLKLTIIMLISSLRCISRLQ